eukprot:s173_g15.t1
MVPLVADSDCFTLCGPVASLSADRPDRGGLETGALIPLEFACNAIGKLQKRAQGGMQGCKFSVLGHSRGCRGLTQGEGQGDTADRGAGTPEFQLKEFSSVFNRCAVCEHRFRKPGEVGIQKKDKDCGELLESN